MSTVVESKPREWPHARNLVTPAWRECSLTRVAELQSLLDWLRRKNTVPDPLADAVEWHLHAARTAAGGRHRLWASLNGSITECTRSNLDAAEASLLRMAPIGYLIGQLPSLLSNVRRHLATGDPRRVEFERLAEKFGATAREQPAVIPLELSEDGRGIIVSAVRAASSEGLREQQRVRSFRNVLVVTAVAMTLIAVGIAVLGFVTPKTVPMCFQPEISGRTVVVCPTGQATVSQDEPGAAGIDSVVRKTVAPEDLFVIEAIGLAAAAVAAAGALRGIQGSSVPYGLPVALALLKLPLGAMTAVLGLLLMRGQFVPGLSNLDTPAQILAWALVFGYAQQLFTRMVDKQAHTVLNAVRGDTPNDPPAGAAAPTGVEAGVSR